MEWVVNSTLPSLYSRERRGTLCIGELVGPTADLDKRGKYRTHQDSIPGPSSLLRVAIPTTLSRLPYVLSTRVKFP